MPRMHNQGLLHVNDGPARHGEGFVAPATLAIGYRDPYSSGEGNATAYNVWATIFNEGSYTRPADFDAGWVVTPSTFPHGTILNWKTPAGAIPNGGGVWGYHHIDRGNYDWTSQAVATTPQQINRMATSNMAYTWSYTGSDNFGLLTEAWLTTSEIADGTISEVAIFEVGFFLRQDDGYVWHSSGTLVGTWNGWTCRAHEHWRMGAGTYIVFAKGSDQLTGTIDWAAALQWLADQRWTGNGNLLTGNLWVNGIGFGVEPTSGGGTGQTTFSNLSIELNGIAAGTPGKVTGVKIISLAPTSFSITWPTLSATVTGYRYRLNGGTWVTATGSATSGIWTENVTGLTNATLYSVEVQAMNSGTNGATSTAVSATTTTAAVAQERLANGSFASADAGWGGFGWSGKSVSGGKAVFASTPAFDGIWQSGITLVAGKYYEITYTISSRTAGTMLARFTGGTIKSGVGRSANGTFQERIQAATGNNQFEFLNTDVASMSIDDVSVMGPYDTSTVGGA